LTGPPHGSPKGLLGFLPPDAQDRLLDNITALSAGDSRLATESFPPRLDLARREQIMRNATRHWREHGFDLEIEDLVFRGERHDVATYLGSRGWHTVGTTTRELLADNGLPEIPRDNDEAFCADYYTSILTK